MKLTILFYVVFSAVVGIIYTTIILYKKIYSILTTSSKKEQEFLDEHSNKKHLQKEIYGKRVVFYGKDTTGEAALKAVESVKKIREKYKLFYIFLIFFTGVIETTITWPKMFYDWSRRN
jgi:hypothetical protein